MWSYVKRATYAHHAGAAGWMDYSKNIEEFPVDVAGHEGMDDGTWIVNGQRPDDTSADAETSAR